MSKSILEKIVDNRNSFFVLANEQNLKGIKGFIGKNNLNTLIQLSFSKYEKKMVYSGIN